MNRNVESHFALNPTNIDMSRSTFDRSASVKTSFNVGDIIPIGSPIEILPGDTVDLKVSKVVRLQTMLTPMMDNLYLDTYWFFVPNRLVWEHWKELMGENTSSPWIPQVSYTVPQITSPASTGWNVGTIADYMGIPTGVAGLSVNALPLRMYALICNDWFRDENLSDPLNIPVTDSTVAGVNTGTFVTDVAKGGLPYKAAKYHDYFTSALPSPQKGPDVSLPVGDDVIVLPKAEYAKSVDMTTKYHARNFDGAGLGTSALPYEILFKNDGTGGQAQSSVTGTYSAGTEFPVIDNLWARTGSALAVTINSLRLAFQIQKFYEKASRGGSRYIETLKVHFGVTSPDARLQRPEYLGGNRIPINVNQVIQQSETATTPQGNVAAMSLTTDVNDAFVKSFVEHGFIIGLMVARYDHTYQQGLNRLWSRKDKFDYYWPVFANIGEQAILNKEIYADGSSTDDEVFGYQEAWADYRYMPSIVTGEMRSQYAQSLDVWHLADDYQSLPQLSSSWIMEDKSNVDRVLAVTSSVSNQLFGDFYLKLKHTRPMPVYSVPGLIDHH